MRILLVGNGFDISHSPKFKFNTFFKLFVKPLFKCEFSKIENYALNELDIKTPIIEELDIKKDLWKEIFETALYKLEKFDSFENLFEYIEESADEEINREIIAKKIKIKKQKINKITADILLFFKHVMLFYFFKLDTLEVERFILSKKYQRQQRRLAKIIFSKYDYCLTTNYTRYLDMLWDDIKQNDLQRNRDAKQVVHLHGAFSWGNVFDFLRKMECEFDTENIVWSDVNQKKEWENWNLQNNLSFIRAKKRVTVKLDIFGFSVDKDNDVIVNIINYLNKSVGIKAEIRLRFFHYGPSDLSGFEDFLVENGDFLKKKKVKVFKEPYKNFYGVYSDKIIKE
jgi:hypothetical protein